MAQFINWTPHSEGTRTNQDPNISVLRISPEGGFGDTLLGLHWRQPRIEVDTQRPQPLALVVQVARGEGMFRQSSAT